MEQNQERQRTMQSVISKRAEIERSCLNELRIAFNRWRDNTKQMEQIKQNIHSQVKVISCLLSLSLSIRMQMDLVPVDTDQYIAHLAKILDETAAIEIF